MLWEKQEVQVINKAKCTKELARTIKYFWAQQEQLKTCVLASDLSVQYQAKLRACVLASDLSVQYQAKLRVCVLASDLAVQYLAKPVFIFVAG